MNRKRDLIINKLDKIRKLGTTNTELMCELDLFQLELLKEFDLIKPSDLINMEYYFNGTSLNKFAGDYMLFKNEITMFVKNIKTGRILKSFIRGWNKQDTVKLRPIGDMFFKSYTLVELSDGLNL